VVQIHRALDENKDTLICIWGANEYAARIGLRIDQGSVRVALFDNAISKIGLRYEGFATAIMKPDPKWEADSEKVFILCSPTWNDAIAQQMGNDGFRNYRLIDGTAFPGAKPRHSLVE
jgi:hypothetical protein